MNNLLISVLFLLSPASVPCAQELVKFKNSNFNQKVIIIDMSVDLDISACNADDLMTTKNSKKYLERKTNSSPSE